RHRFQPGFVLAAKWFRRPGNRSHFRELAPQLAWAVRGAGPTRAAIDSRQQFAERHTYVLGGSSGCRAFRVAPTIASMELGVRLMFRKAILALTAVLAVSLVAPSEALAWRGGWGGWRGPGWGWGAVGVGVGLGLAAATTPYYWG